MEMVIVYRNYARHYRTLLALGALLSYQLVRGELQFVDVTAAAGITHVYDGSGETGVTLDSQWRIFAGGAVAEDFDGDGWIDIFVLQSPGVSSHLYMNNQDGTFTDLASVKGANLTGQFYGTAAADYDRDGDIDIVATSIDSQHVLLVNDGFGSFAKVEGMFPKPVSRGSGVSWADLDNDGLLEVAIGTWSNDSDSTLNIYHNEGAGQLTLRQSYVRNWIFSPHFVDLDLDGDQDLVSVADFSSTTTLLNRRGLLYPHGTSDVQNGMGVASADLNHDGAVDLFISSIRDYAPPFQSTWGATGNRLLLNDGEGDLLDHTTLSGTRDGNWGWGSVLADLDNDGDHDLFHVNGYPATVLDPNFTTQFDQEPARLFENNGDLTFTDVAAAAGATALNQQGRCAIAFDFDRDGDQDLFIHNNSSVTSNGSEPILSAGTPVLLRNESNTGNHWISVSLEGKALPHHSHGMGARIAVRTGSKTQTHQVNASTGYNGHGPNRIAHIGIGSLLSIDELLVTWTTGDVTVIGSPPIDTDFVVASPPGELNQRSFSLGQTLEGNVPVSEIPSGGSVAWSYQGTSYSNPCSIPIATAGDFELVSKVYDSMANLVREDRFPIEVVDSAISQHTVARLWNEENLDAIRVDFPDPTKHARNLFHTSVAMWDAWAFYDSSAAGYYSLDKVSGSWTVEERNSAISYAAYRVLANRYASSVNFTTTLASLELRMESLGLDSGITTTVGNSPAAIGNRVAASVLQAAASDRWDDLETFAGGVYSPANIPLQVNQPDLGIIMADKNRWQPLRFILAFSQNGEVSTPLQSFLGANWGGVRNFSLGIREPGALLYLDPGAPPYLGGSTDALFKEGTLNVIRASRDLHVDSLAQINTSPGAMGNNSLGQNDGSGYPMNPETGQPYSDSLVPLGDFGRVLAEFWADGPDSETPPGHWNTLANRINDSPNFSRKFEGEGAELDSLEWDVKLYLALNGALHDAAIVAWGTKRVYDYVRPISAIRYMASQGQSTNPDGASYDPDGLPLEAGLVEMITAATAAPGEKHEHLASAVGEVAIFAWSAANEDVVDGVGEVGWVRAKEWIPYQAATFVTPAFAGYVSGHSVFSRSAAEVLTQFTGSPYFPEGEGSFTAKANSFLGFDRGPSQDVHLRWATYYDASDQAGLSRIYGGIHFPVDDGPGRVMGSECGKRAFGLSKKYFDGSIRTEIPEIEMRGLAGNLVNIHSSSIPGRFYRIESSDSLETGSFAPLTSWSQAEEHKIEFSETLSSSSARQFFRVEQSEVAN
ncbi:MAG: FG-GAP-like repeat-containing protein [Roseibacillus sp.]